MLPSTYVYSTSTVKTSGMISVFLWIFLNCQTQVTDNIIFKRTLWKYLIGQVTIYLSICVCQATKFYVSWVYKSYGTLQPSHGRHSDTLLTYRMMRPRKWQCSLTVAIMVKTKERQGPYALTLQGNRRGIPYVHAIYYSHAIATGGAYVTRHLHQSQV